MYSRLSKAIWPAFIQSSGLQLDPPVIQGTITAIFSSCLATLHSAVFRPQSTVFSLQLNFKSQSNVAAERGMVRISFVADGGRRFVNNKQVECKLSVAVAREKQKTRLQQQEKGKK